MNSLKKYSAVFLVMLLLLPVLTACAKSPTTVELEAKNEIEASIVEEVLKASNEGIAPLLYTYNADYMEAVVAGGQYAYSVPFTKDLIKRWRDFEAEHGAIVDAEAVEAEAEEDGYVSHLILTGEDGGMMRLNVTFTKDATPYKTTLEKYADDSDQTLGSKMAQAGMNTLVGLLVVFSVLILLSLIISSFGLIGKAQDKAARKNMPVKNEVKEAIQSAQAKAEADGEAVTAEDEKQIIAVIAAAIAAYTDAPVVLGTDPYADGTIPENAYVVRSIRRLKNNKW